MGNPLIAAHDEQSGRPREKAQQQCRPTNRDADARATPHRTAAPHTPPQKHRSTILGTPKGGTGSIGYGGGMVSPGTSRVVQQRPHPLMKNQYGENRRDEAKPDTL